MFKILILGGIIYFIYRFYILPPTLDKAEQQPPITDNKAKPKEQHDDGEFIDYEEVD